LGLIVWAMRARVGDRTTHRTIVSAETIGLWAALFFGLAILGTRSLFDAQTNPNMRLLYPAFVGLLVTAVEVAARPAGSERDQRWRVAIGVLGILAATAGIWHSVSSAVDQAGSLTFASPEFRSAPTVQLLDEADLAPDIYSNVPDGLWYVGVPGARPIPVTFDPLSLLDNEDLDREMEQLRAEVQRGAAIFYYRAADPSYYLVDEEALREIAPCVAVEDDQGVVLVDDENPLCET
jgi:hypothetical protein